MKILFSKANGENATWYDGHHLVVSMQNTNRGPSFILFRGRTCVAFANISVGSNNVEIEYLCARKGHGYGLILGVSLMKHYANHEFTLYSVGDARQFCRKIGFKNAGSRSDHDPNTTRGNAMGPMKMTDDRRRKLLSKSE